MHFKTSSAKWRPFRLSLIVLIEIQTFSLTTIRLKTLSAKGCPFRLGLNVLRDRVTLGACNDSSTDAQLYSRAICCHFTKPNQWPAVLVWDPKGHAAANLTVQHHYITSPSFGPWRDILNAIPTVTGISGLLYFTNLVKSPGVKDFDNIGQRNSLLPVGTGLYLNQSCHTVNVWSLINSRFQWKVIDTSIRYGWVFTINFKPSQSFYTVNNILGKSLVYMSIMPLYQIYIDDLLKQLRSHSHGAVIGKMILLALHLLMI